MADFKKQNEQKYTNKFSTEPTSRPSYIPASTMVGGAAVPVAFNSAYGGYGYYNGPTFIPYDPFVDLSAAAWNSYALSHRPVVVASSSSGTGFFLFFMILMFAGLMVALWFYIRNRHY
jgi:hypothetical protein